MSIELLVEIFDSLLGSVSFGNFPLHPAGLALGGTAVSHPRIEDMDFTSPFLPESSLGRVRLRVVLGAGGVESSGRLERHLPRRAAREHTRLCTTLFSEHEVSLIVLTYHDSPPLWQ